MPHNDLVPRDPLAVDQEALAAAKENYGCGQGHDFDTDADVLRLAAITTRAYAPRIAAYERIRIAAIAFGVPENDMDLAATWDALRTSLCDFAKLDGLENPHIYRELKGWGVDG